MTEAEFRIVSNEAGEATAFLVPIELWPEIASERETAHLLKAVAMKQRLIASKLRAEGISFEPALEKFGV